MRVLRDYQQECAESVLEAWKTLDRVLVCMATGTGKTACASRVIADWPSLCDGYGKNERVLWLAQRDELIAQAAEAIEDATGECVAIEKGDQHVSDSAALFNRRVVVSSNQTMQQEARRSQFGRSCWGLVVQDECLIPGTLVDGKPIEQFSIGDTVSCVDHETGTICRSVVTRAFIHRTKKLIRITFLSGQSLVCTPNHPIYSPVHALYFPSALLYHGMMVSTTQKQEVINEDYNKKLQSLPHSLCSQMAGDKNLFKEMCLRVKHDVLSVKCTSDTVLHLRRAGSMLRKKTSGTGETGEGFLFGRMQNQAYNESFVRHDEEDEQEVWKAVCRQNESKQSNEQTGSPRTYQNIIAGNRLETSRSSWQRNGTDCTRTITCERSRMGERGCSEDIQTERQRLSSMLQARCWERDTKDWDRNRRAFPQTLFSEGTRLQEDYIPNVDWVDRIEVLEPGGDGEFERLCPDGIVYNLEVENHNNYFANGVLVHNCAHAVAPGHLETLEYFDQAKLLGLTATPDRADEVSLGKIFQACPFYYDILTAIKEGWLCSVRQEYIESVELDFLDAKAEDFTNAELDRIIAQERPLHNIVSSSVPLIGDRPTLVYTPSVASAEASAQLYKRYGKSAETVSGTTDEDERRRIIEGFRDGKFQVLTNCALLTEGVDLPNASCIVNARPTKSRSLFTQMVGRILRGGPRCPVPGKTDALVVDLTGASLKHKLCHVADVLGGKYDEAVLEEVRKRCRQFAQMNPGSGGADVFQELLRAAARADELVQKKRAEIIATAKVKRKTVDPFTVFAEALQLPASNNLPSWWAAGTEATPYQVAQLEKAGIKAEGALTQAEAQQLIEEVKRRKRDRVCSYKQARLLKARGISCSLSTEQASAVFDLFSHRKEGLKFTKDDAIRVAISKRRGTPFEYKEIKGVPNYLIYWNAPARISQDGQTWQEYNTKKTLYPNKVEVIGDRVRFQQDGYTVDVPADRVCDLKKNKWLAEPKAKQYQPKAEAQPQQEAF